MMEQGHAVLSEQGARDSAAAHEAADALMEHCTACLHGCARNANGFWESYCGVGAALADESARLWQVSGNSW